MIPPLQAFPFIIIPTIVIWLILSRVAKLHRWLNIFASGLAAGLLFSGILMWEDAAEGFCCREYHATVLTELAMYLPLALGFAVVAWVTLVVIDFALTRLRA
jgi:hypothetical protein